ncbi:MAG: DNA mismatch repair protein MutS [Chitinophagaceae bacterium]|nr:DNA mismatch repair protein MutS [Chitinophagaceae bacterium]
MNIDKTTLQDLAIFHTEEEQSVFSKLNFAQTTGGAHWLAHLLSHPYHELKPILETQAALKQILTQTHLWPQQITNGTIMVLEKYYQSQIDTIPAHAGPLQAYTYKLLHGPDFSLVRYTVGHAIDFLQGMQQFADLFTTANGSTLLNTLIARIQLTLSKPVAKELIAVSDKKSLSAAQYLQFGHFLLYHYKNQVHELIELYGRLDAYYSLARAIQVHNMQFPEVNDSTEPHFNAHSLRHILLEEPVSYQVSLNQSTNFVFLTGANMAGKSTFIKAVGIAAYLAHLGMAVPAEAMRLSLFHGMISNIQVSDNLVKGESYFFNEVHRIRNTITRIADGQKWLVLIDELFKGTNVQDAMRCSTTVIKGLLKIRTSLFILSTHLYEIGEELKPYPNIAFKFFETHVQQDQLSFSYQLKDGISNDRLGYLILKREGVVDMIDKL